MKKPYGIRAELNNYPWHDIAEEFEQNGFVIKIHAGLIEVEYDNEDDKSKAIELAELYLSSYSLRTGNKLTASFNYSRKPMSSGGTLHEVGLDSEVKLTERLQVQLTQPATTRIVNQPAHDSASFVNDTWLVEQALIHPVVSSALHYFSSEVADNERPLYGAYKAIEVITNQLGRDGRKKLAALAGENEKYVSDLMETTNTERHAVSPARALLSDQVCVERTRKLIEGYARSVAA
jgi:hypothetical protein